MSSPTHISCPHCGMEHPMSLEYLAENGGMKTACSKCGGEMTVPTLPPPGGSSGNSGPQPANRSAASFGVGRNEPPGSVWRDGKYVVAYRGSELPANCPRCGGPGETTPFRLELKWVPRIYTGFVEVSMIAKAVMAQDVHLNVHFCEKHRRRHTRGRQISVLLPALGVLAFAIMTVLALYTLIPDLLLAGLAVFGFFAIVTGLFWGYFHKRKLVAIRLDPQFVWLAGCHPNFMAGFRDVSENASLAPGKFGRIS